MAQTKIQEMREMELKLFIIEFNKGSQIDRSLGNKISEEKKKQFREITLQELFTLIGKVDNNYLKNVDIFNSIKKVKNVDDKISFGQAQKVINVVMKQYCFVTNQKENILKELDCPLDSITMKGCNIKNKRMCDVTESDYLDYQKRFEEKFGLKVLKDREYDENRISDFLTNFSK